MPLARGLSQLAGLITIDGNDVIMNGALGATNLIGNNTGDETLATIKSKLGVTTLSGTNTGDQIIPTTLPASDVYAWAKATIKPTYYAADVGLGSVDNTSDLAKPVSTAQAEANTAVQNAAASDATSKANARQATLVSGTNIRTVNGQSVLGTGDLTISSSSVTMSTTVPNTPSSGDQWWDSTEGALYIYYDDGDSLQWVPSTNNFAGPVASTTESVGITTGKSIAMAIVFG